MDFGNSFNFWVFNGGNMRNTLCGDYIFSGHSAAIITCFLFIQDCLELFKLCVLLNRFLKTALAVGGLSTIANCLPPQLGLPQLFWHEGITVWMYLLLIGLRLALFGFTTFLPIAQNSGFNNFLEFKMEKAQKNNVDDFNYLTKFIWFPLFYWMEGKIQGPLPRK